MSGIKRLYPPDGKNLLDGGMNSKYQPTLIGDTESPDCLNVVFKDGGVGTRDGFSKVNTASVGSFVCDGLYTRIANNLAETMVVFFGGTGYTLAGTSFTAIASATSVFTAGTRIAAAQQENHIFFSNGSSNYKWNGTDFTQHGVASAPMAASFNSNGAGNPNGDYNYKFTFVNSALVEGNVSASSTTFNVVSKIISITSIPVAAQSFGVSARKIYRTVAGGTAFKLVTTLSDNTTTSYNDNISDANLGVTAPTGKGVPPPYTVIKYHSGRLWMNDTVNPSFIWYTDANEPYTVGPTNFLIIGDASGEIVRAFEILDDALIIFTETNCYVVGYDLTLTTFTVKKAKSSYSSKSPFGTFTYNNKIAFPAIQNGKFCGIAATIQGNVEPYLNDFSRASVASELKSDPIEPDMFDIQESYLGNISTIVYKNIAYIAMTKGTNNTTNNRVYTMDFSINRQSKKTQEAWSPWSGLNVAQFTIYGGLLYYGTSTATGFVYKQAVGVYSDDGTAINSYFYTKEYSGLKNENSHLKDFRFINFLYDLAGVYFMNIYYKTDSDKGVGLSQTLSLDPHTSTWGTMVWGTSLWGGGNYQMDSLISLSSSRGKRIQFKFSNQNTVNQRFKVHWLNFTYNLKGQR